VDNDQQDLKKLREYLDILAEKVENENNAANMAEHVKTLNSLNKQIDEAVGRSTRPAHTFANDPNTGFFRTKDEHGFSTAPAEPVPVIDRRAAIQHTRKLNESGNDS